MKWILRNTHPIVALLSVHLTLVHSVTVNVDTSQAPDLADFGRQVKATLEDWYPRVVRILHSPTFQHVNAISITFDPNYNGVAYASGNRIVGAVNYYRQNKHDVGSMIHEMAHVIQQYRACQGWVQEGIADWVRYFHFEPNRRPAKPRPNETYKSGYGTAAYFLNWINQRYNYPMIYWINKDCREGTYKDNIFPRLTRRTVDQHWRDMVGS